jgi:hypothetical protein
MESGMRFFARGSILALVGLAAIASAYGGWAGSGALLKLRSAHLPVTALADATRPAVASRESAAHRPRRSRSSPSGIPPLPDAARPSARLTRPLRRTACPVRGPTRSSPPNRLVLWSQTRPRRPRTCSVLRMASTRSNSPVWSQALQPRRRRRFRPPPWWRSASSCSPPAGPAEGAGRRGKLPGDNPRWRRPPDLTDPPTIDFSLSAWKPPPGGFFVAAMRLPLALLARFYSRDAQFRRNMTPGRQELNIYFQVVQPAACVNRVRDVVHRRIYALILIHDTDS